MLKVTNLCAGYGKNEILHGVDAVFETGKLNVLIGPNGSGKSTLLKAMLGLIPTTYGEVTLQKSAVLSLSRNEIAKRITFLAQSNATPDMTVEAFVLHGRFPYLGYLSRYSANDRALARAAIEKMELAEKANEPLSSLSGGMKQKAYIARALTQDTEYILLDEPTTYLDVAHQISLMQILRGLANEGRGIVCVMHDLPLAFTFADSVAVLENGRLCMQDTPGAVCESAILKSVFGTNVVFENEQYRYDYALSKNLLQGTEQP